MSHGFPILVTGGAGYIGSHVCKALPQGGYLPITYDNLVYSHRWVAKWGPLEEGDISNRQRLDVVFYQYQPQAVMHFAAFAYVGESVQNPGKYYRNTVTGSLTLVEAMRDHQVSRMIFSSTCATYGILRIIPITEDHLQKPINPYGTSKLMIERIVSDFGLAHGVRSVFLRYFNAAGADPEGDLGEEHYPETHLIPLVIRAALGQIPNAEIYGTDYLTPDGTAIRDYVHVTDLAEAHVRALTYHVGGGINTALNLGTGRGHSVREVIAMVEKVTGKSVPTLEAPRRAGDPPVLVADSTRAAKVLGWRPRYSDLHTIVDSAWNWHANGQHGSRKEVRRNKVSMN
jgi:UDP-arabinose 4-epimerase